MRADGGFAFGDIVVLLGPETALQLARALVGKRLYVPRTAPGPHSKLVRLIGPVPAARLCDAAPGAVIEMPSRAAKAVMIHHLRRAGHPIEEIANRLLMSRSGVKAILGRPAPIETTGDRLADDITQLDLFGG
jgi:hypothetical protein